MQSDFHPLLSIVSPVFNCSNFFAGAYANLSSQNFQQWEWIIVDDGSTDDLKALVSSINDDRIKYFCLPRNMGRGYARNYCIMNVSSEIIVNWDIDDSYPSNRLFLIYEAFKGGIDFTYEPVRITNSTGDVIRTLDYAGGSFFKCPFHNTLAFRKSLGLKYLYQMLGTVGGIGEDPYLVLMLSILHKGLKLKVYSNYYQSREVFARKSFHSHLGALLAYARVVFYREISLWIKLKIILVKVPKSLLAGLFYSFRTYFY